MVVLMMLEELRHNREIDGTYIDTVTVWEPECIESVVKLLHNTAIQELLSRNILSVWDWELRTKNMFQANKLKVVNDLVNKKQEDMKQIVGCGETTKKEVYAAFLMYHIRLKYWKPRINEGDYKFQ